ncbi:MAG TPA: hypothetical protein ENI33_04705 [Thermoplasmatales archaeon]|nr:hypothetical protein [Thermoplasmatales archaeon]
MMNFKKVIFALNSDTRLRIIQILDNCKNCGVMEILKNYTQLYNPQIHRETIYRELEKLVDAGIVEKKYDTKNKKIYYELKIKKLKIDILKRKIFISNELEGEPNDG